MSRLPTSRTWSHRRIGGAGLLAGILALGCASAALASPAQPGAEHRAAATVPLPWQKAGPGWAVAVYSAAIVVPGQPSQDKPGVTTLYLIPPFPHTSLYQVFVWPKSLRPAWTVLDWSGDKKRVLLEAPGSGGKSSRYEQISLATRKVVSSFRLPANVTVFGYTRPNGLNVLATRPHGTSARQIVRYDLAGKLQAVLATGKVLTTAIDSPNGASVIIGTSTGIERVSNTGGAVKAFRPPVPVLGCGPIRWWNARTVLAGCSAKGIHPYPRLWLFPVSGSGKVTALTPQRLGHGPDYGDIGAWRLSTGRLYLQALGASGSEFIGWQWRNATLHPVSVPGAANDDRIVTSSGARLLIQVIDGSPGRSPLIWFDPVTDNEFHVLRPGPNQVGVTSWAPFGRTLT